MAVRQRWYGASWTEQIQLRQKPRALIFCNVKNFPICDLKEVIGTFPFLISYVLIITLNLKSSKNMSDNIRKGRESDYL